ncbi:RsmD family RNA methyltransferase [Candidatus Saccharibacteria bacterium]|nr:RsmD family RNA methyltransferase [Candidatus Saccharibacteria bacterium]
MRIIAGSLKSRTFDSVSGHRTHPMSEKIRGAIFNALGDIKGLTVLDAFAGTGAVSFEALSRGAKSATLLDADTKAHKVIQQNTANLGLDNQVDSLRIHAHAWSRRNPDAKFDIVILDPPYDNISPKELLVLTKHVKQGGVLVLSLPPDNGFLLGESKQELLLQKNYGDAELFFYRQLV